MQIWDKLCFLIWRTTQKMTMKKPCTTGHGTTQYNRSYCTNSYLIQCLLSVLWSGWSRCFCPQPQGNRLNINMSEIVTVGLDFEFREYLNKLKIVAYLYAEIKSIFLENSQINVKFDILLLESGNAESDGCAAEQRKIMPTKCRLSPPSHNDALITGIMMALTVTFPQLSTLYS